MIVNSKLDSPSIMDRKSVRRFIAMHREIATTGALHAMLPHIPLASYIPVVEA
jgi:hypothetical protein